jgi:hypothetical protein
MNKPVQEAVQSRDEAVQASRPDWQPRTDGLKAILVNERSTVFDRPAVVPLQAIEPAYDGAFGPMPTEWTHDLVHCRLVHVDALCRRLPRVKVPPQYRSFLGALQPEDAAVEGRVRALTVEQERMVDWTLARIYAFGPVDRAVLMGMMAGRSLRTISKVTLAIELRGEAEGDRGLKKPSVAKRYRRNATILAQSWNMLRVPIDDGTCRCWNTFAKKV